MNLVLVFVFFMMVWKRLCGLGENWERRVEFKEVSGIA